MGAPSTRPFSKSLATVVRQPNNVGLDSDSLILPPISGGSSCAVQIESYYNLGIYGKHDEDRSYQGTFFLCINDYLNYKPLTVNNNSLDQRDYLEIK